MSPARPTGRRAADRTTVTVRAVRALTITFVCLLFGSFAASAPAAAADGESTWGVHTADTSAGTGRQNYVYTAAPGTRIEDALVVTNYGPTPLTLQLSAADGFTNADGQLDARPHADAPAQIGAWVTMAAPSVTIPAGKGLQVPFTLAVPAAVAPGDYAGAVLTSLTGPGSAPGINVDRRLGIRIQLRVSGTLTPGLSIEDLHVDYAGSANPLGTGTATVSYTVHNTGNVRLAADQSVRLTGPFGLLGPDAPAVAPIAGLLPGESARSSVTIDDVVPGVVLSATVEVRPRPAVDPGAGSAAAADAGLPPMEPVSQSVSTPAVPWAALVLLTLLAAAAWLVRRRVLAGRRAQARRVEEAVAAALAGQSAGASADLSRSA